MEYECTIRSIEYTKLFFNIKASLYENMRGSLCLWPGQLEREVPQGRLTTNGPLRLIHYKKNTREQGVPHLTEYTQINSTPSARG